jgi:hypothetical protein
MRVRLSNSESAHDLGEFLRARVGAIVEQQGAGANELEVSLLGSFGEDAMRSEVDAAVRRWTLVRQQPGTVIEVE